MVTGINFEVVFNLSILLNMTGVWMEIELGWSIAVFREPLSICLNPQLEVQRRMSGKASDLSTREGRQDME